MLQWFSLFLLFLIFISLILDISSLLLGDRILLNIRSSLRGRSSYKYIFLFLINTLGLTINWVKSPIAKGAVLNLFYRKRLQLVVLEQSSHLFYFKFRYSIFLLLLSQFFLESLKLILTWFNLLFPFPHFKPMSLFFFCYLLF